MIECLLRASPLNKVSSGENTNATEMHIKTYLNRYCRNGARNAGVPSPELSLLPYCSFSVFFKLFVLSSCRASHWADIGVRVSPEIGSSLLILAVCVTLTHDDCVRCQHMSTVSPFPRCCLVETPLHHACCCIILSLRHSVPLHHACCAACGAACGATPPLFGRP